jgi:hypothetical protein
MYLQYGLLHDMPILLPYLPLSPSLQHGCRTALSLQPLLSRFPKLFMRRPSLGFFGEEGYLRR